MFSNFLEYINPCSSSTYTHKKKFRIYYIYARKYNTRTYGRNKDGKVWETFD